MRVDDMTASQWKHWCQMQKRCKVDARCVFCNRNFKIPPKNWDDIDTTEEERKTEEWRNARSNKRSN